jgi:hypothetical protein
MLMASKIGGNPSRKFQLGGRMTKDTRHASTPASKGKNNTAIKVKGVKTGKRKTPLGIRSTNHAGPSNWKGDSITVKIEDDLVDEPSEYEGWMKVQDQAAWVS